jgi:hypothetical protein
MVGIRAEFNLIARLGESIESEQSVLRQVPLKDETERSPLL